MEKFREFLGHARECEQLAKNASDPSVRQQWESLAKTWRALAIERQKMFKLPEIDDEGTSP